MAVKVEASSTVLGIHTMHDIFIAVIANNTPLDNIKIPIENCPMAVNGQVHVHIKERLKIVYPREYPVVRDLL